MPSTSPLSKLPVELLLQIIENCDNPKDVQSFISADPAPLSVYMAYRQSILPTLRDHLEDRLVDPKLRPDIRPGMIPKANIAGRLLLIHQRQAEYTFEEYQHAVRVLLSSQIDLHKLPQSLALLSALSKMLDDTDGIISSYRSEELREQQMAALQGKCEDAGTTRSECLPCEPDAAERYRLYKAMLYSQSCQHAYSYGGERVDAPGLYDNLYPPELFWNAMSRTELENAVQ